METLFKKGGGAIIMYTVSEPNLKEIGPQFVVTNSVNPLPKALPFSNRKFVQMIKSAPSKNLHRWLVNQRWAVAKKVSPNNWISIYILSDDLFR